MKACFGSSYMYTLLKDGFHVPEAARFVTYTNIVENRAGEKLDVNWVLGALLVEVLTVEEGMQTTIQTEHHAGGKQLAGSEPTPSGAESALLDGGSVAVTVAGPSTASTETVGDPAPGTGAGA